MSKIRLKFKRGAFAELRTQPKVRADIERRAAAVAAACNADSTWGGYKSGPEAQNQSRAAANVWTVSAGAREDNARNQRMIRNLQAGR